MEEDAGSALPVEGPHRSCPTTSATVKASTPRFYCPTDSVEVCTQIFKYTVLLINSGSQLHDNETDTITKYYAAVKEMNYTRM